VATTHFFSVALAERYGPIESIILSNICWWVETNRKNNKHCYQNKYWTYGSASGFKAIFSYLPGEQIRRTLARLREEGALMTGNFNKMRYDRTLWYTVSDEVMDLYNNKAVGDGQNAGESEKTEIHLAPTPNANGNSPITEDRESEISEIHSAPVPNANGNSPKSIWHLRQMDLAPVPNGFGKFAGPIPILNIYKKAAAAEFPESPEKVKNKNAAAAVFNQKNPGEEKIKSHLAKLSGELIFTDDFYTKALGWLNENTLDNGYLDWMFAECGKRKPRNMRGMFYRLFYEADMVEGYKAVKTASGHSFKTIRCPACGASHDENLPECPNCGLKADSYFDAGAVERQKRINALSPEARAEYESEISFAGFEMLDKLRQGGKKDYNKGDQWVEIDKKYHIIE
jgi:hypothetical protein